MSPQECPIQQSITQRPDRWWAIRSKTTGHLATVGPMGQGAVLAYYNEEDAQADAASLQQTQPNLIWEPLELPGTPPKVCLPDGYQRVAKPVAVTMRVRSRRTGELLNIRIAARADVEEESLTELSAMIEIASSHWDDTHEVLDVSTISLGEIRESQPTKKKGAA